MPGPMEGVTIVEMSVALTGPLAVAMLVDQGAEAVKVESPGLGDQGRYIGVGAGGISAMFQICNRGKRAVAVDCRDPRGRDIVMELAAGADVFVQNMRPGAVERLGLGYEAVAERNPGIVYASITGFGPDGPYAHRRAYDSVLQAQAGLAANQTGLSDDRPKFLRQAAADKITAHTACQAITAALFARARGAGGQHVELSMLDATIAYLFPDSAGHEVALDNDQPHLGQSIVANQRAMAFTDGHAVIAAVTDSEFHGMGRAFGVDTSAPALATMADRWKNKEAYSRAVRAAHAAAASMTLAEGVEAMEREDIPYGVVLAVEDLAGDAQVVHNALLEEHDHPAMGRIRQPRVPARFGGTPASFRNPSAPTVGQHTDEVLTELGWGDRLAELRADKVVA